jgi:hypothetical protein
MYQQTDENQLNRKPDEQPVEQSSADHPIEGEVKQQAKKEANVPSSMEIITVPLDHIEIPRNAFIQTKAMMQYASKETYFITENVLPYLQLSDPIVVTGNKAKKNQRYKLLSGIRTFQMIYQLKGIDEKCMVFLIKKLGSLKEEGFQVMDVLVRTILNCPSSGDIENIGALLFMDENMREKLSEFMPMNTQEDVSKAIGVNRGTLREWALKKNKTK